VKAGFELVYDGIEFVRRVGEVALIYGYRPIEICWMTWLIQPEGKEAKTKMLGILSKFNICIKLM